MGICHASDTSRRQTASTSLQREYRWRERMYVPLRMTGTCVCTPSQSPDSRPILSSPNPYTLATGYWVNSQAAHLRGKLSANGLRTEHRVCGWHAEPPETAETSFAGELREWCQCSEQSRSSPML